MSREFFVVPQVVKKSSAFCIVSAVDLRKNAERSFCCSTSWKKLSKFCVVFAVDLRNYPENFLLFHKLLKSFSHFVLFLLLI
jgi:hypothetical protein